MIIYIFMGSMQIFVDWMNYDASQNVCCHTKHIALQKYANVTSPQCNKKGQANQINNIKYLQFWLNTL